MSTGLTLIPGVYEKSFDNDTLTPSNGVTWTIPILHGKVSYARSIIWGVTFSSAPSAVDVILEASLDGTTWYTLDEMTNTAGEYRTLSSFLGKFVRARVDSVTGGSGITVEFMI